MQRWQHRVAVVTGASSGIGAAIALDLIKAGMKVAALDRRKQGLEELNTKLPEDMRARFHGIECDITDEQAVLRTFQWVELHLGGVDVLINNAGVMREADLVQAGNTNALKDIVETNIMGVAYCTREAFNIMQRKGVNDGHVVIINSIAGHRTHNLGESVPSFNIYPATKHAVTSMAETYRQEFLRHKTKIRITSISPGAVNTKLFPQKLHELFEQIQQPMLQPEDVSNAVIYALSVPAHVQIYELKIKPVGEIVD